MLGLHGSMHEGDKEGGCACGVNGIKGGQVEEQVHKTVEYSGNTELKLL